MCPQMLLSDPENTLLPKIAQITITYKAFPLVKTMASSKKKTHNKTIIRSENSDLRITREALFVILGTKTTICESFSLISLLPQIWEICFLFLFCLLILQL
jgi:hypothetical protein